MSQNIHIRIFHSIDAGLCIIVSGTGRKTGNMKAGNGNIHFAQYPFLQIHTAFGIQNIQLCAYQQLYPISMPIYYTQIVKVDRIAATRHFGCMLGNSQQFQPFFLSRFCIFPNGAVSMSACEGVGMGIQNISDHFAISFCRCFFPVFLL